MKESLYRTVHSHNILPLTSRCNTACIFCSHRQNPDKIETIRVEPLSWEEIEDLAIFLSPDKKIVLGESATRIIEGEPFTHPQITEILSFIRKKFPHTPIQITTNGILLNQERVKFLKTIDPLEINLSINTLSPEWRNRIMNDKNSTDIIDAVKYMAEEEIIYHGSIVAMPWLVGWQEIENTIAFLNDFGACTVRVFMPGYTKFGPVDLVPPVNLEQELRDFITKCRKKYYVPICMEPSGVKDIQPIIAGIIQESPAHIAGLEPGDKIKLINGRVPFSRAAAFRELKGPGSYTVEVERRLSESKIILINIPQGKKSGLVMDYDLEDKLARDLAGQISKRKHTLLLSSRWGAPLLKAGLTKLQVSPKDYKIIPVDNLTFGGNINCAGLLTVADFLFALEVELRDTGSYDQILLPAISFDYKGKDLLGRHYSELMKKWEVDTKIL